MHLTVPTALLASTMIMLAHSGSLAGKDAPKAEIKISYNYRHLFFRGSDGVVEINNRYILLANQKESKFYSPQTEYLDSLDSTPEGRAVSRQLMDIGVKRYLETGDRSAVPHNDGDIYVFKSIPETETEVYDRAGMIEFGHYTEPFAEMEWAIGKTCWAMNALWQRPIITAGTGMYGSLQTYRYTTARGNSADCPGLYLKQTRPTDNIRS